MGKKALLSYWNRPGATSVRSIEIGRKALRPGTSRYQLSKLSFELKTALGAPIQTMRPVGSKLRSNLSADLRASAFLEIGMRSLKVEDGASQASRI